ncbi:hypothetical protein VTN77DRAFT_6025 [Rasamsonia byssochlamydoides]|uniref:uncharacterized protein n=1 Tax=Rasamsonia byssochlamydoides TaxID=89139 RepID=UPI0037429341
MQEKKRNQTKKSMGSARHLFKYSSGICYVILFFSLSLHNSIYVGNNPNNTGDWHATLTGTVGRLDGLVESRLSRKTHLVTRSDIILWKKRDKKKNEKKIHFLKGRKSGVNTPSGSLKLEKSSASLELQPNYLGNTYQPLVLTLHDVCALWKHVTVSMMDSFFFIDSNIVTFI